MDILPTRLSGRGAGHRFAQGVRNALRLGEPGGFPKRLSEDVFPGGRRALERRGVDVQQHAFERDERAILIGGLEKGPQPGLGSGQGRRRFLLTRDMTACGVDQIALGRGHP